MSCESQKGAASGQIKARKLSDRKTVPYYPPLRMVTLLLESHVSLILDIPCSSRVKGGVCGCCYMEPGEKISKIVPDTTVTGPFSPGPIEARVGTPGPG